MNKKQFYILTTCCLVALLVLFEVVLFIAFGGERLEQSGWVKWALCRCTGFDRPAVLFAGLYHKSEVWRLKRITHKSTPCGLELHGAFCYVYYFTLTDLVVLQAE